MNSARALLPALLLELCWAALACAAPAQTKAQDALAAQLQRCAALSDATARLACYDALAASGPAAASNSRVIPASPVLPAPPPVSPASPSVAGSAPPSTSVADFGVRNGPLQAKRDPVHEKRMLAVVSRVGTRAGGELVVTLDNGQVWVQNQPGDYPVKPGDSIEIDVGAVGSYVLWSPAHRRATKVTRVD